MNIDVRTTQTSGLCIVRGCKGQLDHLESSLRDWAGQTRRGMSVWIRRDKRTLEVLTGALLACGLWEVQPLALTAEELTTLAELESWGFLRPYQAAAVRAALVAPCGRGIVSVPTGGGKTRIAHALASVTEKSWVYLAPNQELARQTADGAPLNLACYSFGTAPADALAGAHGLVVDEVHRAGARTWSRVILRSAAVRRVGLSGTPLLRCDSRNTIVMSLLGPVVYEISMKALESDGFIAPGVVRNVSLSVSKCQ